MVFNALAKLYLLFFVSLITINSSFSQNNTSLPANLQQTQGFVENKGQIQDQFFQQVSAIKYLLTGAGINVQLQTNCFSYDTYEFLSKSPILSKTSPLLKKGPGKQDSTLFRFHRVDVILVGANSSPRIIAEAKSDNYVMYYNTNSSEGIQAYSYKRIIYKEIYRGIDLVFESYTPDNKKGFEYYFIVKPGADAGQIKLQYKGAQTALKNNKIIVSVLKGNLEERIPASYLAEEEANPLNGLSNKPQVKVLYKDCSKNTYTFSTPKYDRRKTLIIDPTPDLVWGTYYGGELGDIGTSITRDQVGDIIVGGATANPNLATTGAFQSTFFRERDALLGKFKSNGTLLWMTYYGGRWEEAINDVCIDKHNNIYVGGATSSKTGIATPGTYQPKQVNPNYDLDGFLAKFDSKGKRIWGTYYGGTFVDWIYGIKVDANDRVFVTGGTYSTNGIATPGSFQQAYAGGTSGIDFGDGFLACLDNTGNQVWGTYYGGAFMDCFYSLAMDNKGNSYAVGITYSPNGLASPDAFQKASNGIFNTILVKFDGSGKRVWATYYGGTNEDYAMSITCDHQNNVIVGGEAISQTGITTPGSYQPQFGGSGRDAFIVKFNEDGKRLWATYYGGNGEEWIRGIATDADDNIYFAGMSSSTNNIATSTAYQPTGPAVIGQWTPIVVKLNSSGYQVWGTYYGYGDPRTVTGEALDIVAENAGNVFVCGYTSSPNNISTCGAVQEHMAENGDMFVGMFSETYTAVTVSATITSDQTQAVCPGTPLTFTATALNGGTKPSYQWKVNGALVGANEAVLTINTLKNKDQVSCTVTSNSPCITNPVANSNVLQVAILPDVLPTLHITSDASGTVCPGTSVTFTATPQNGGNAPAFHWKVNGIETGSDSSTFITSMLNNNDVVSCIITNPLLCSLDKSATSNNIVVNVASGQRPSIKIAASQTELCAGSPVSYSTVVENAGSNPGYTWMINRHQVGSGSGFTTTKLSNGDSVQCLLTPSSEVCAGSASIESNTIAMDVYPLPGVIIQPENPIITSGDTLQITLVSANNNLTYKWTPAQNISNTSISNPKVWPSSTQMYNLRVTFEQGCTMTKEVTVYVITDVKVPSAFTPNGDGLNDRWEIKGLELYPSCIVTVFDRWGGVIFQSHGYSKPWDGTYKGKEFSTGSFVYLIDLKNGTNALKGAITIIR